MAYEILSEGFENSVRAKLGVKKSELSDIDIQDKFIAKMAEGVVKRRIPKYLEIEDEDKLFFLESAVINYICYLLAPTMPNKIKYKVSTIEVKWETLKTDWDERAEDFLNAFEEDLESLDMYESSGDGRLFVIAKMVRDGDES